MALVHKKSRFLTKTRSSSTENQASHFSSNRPSKENPPNQDNKLKLKESPTKNHFILANTHSVLQLQKHGFAFTQTEHYQNHNHKQPCVVGGYILAANQCT
jgi:hypothetical protein